VTFPSPTADDGCWAGGCGRPGGQSRWEVLPRLPENLQAAARRRWRDLIAWDKFADWYIDDQAGLTFRDPVFQFDASAGDAPAFWTLSTNCPPDFWYNFTVNDFADGLNRAEART